MASSLIFRTMLNAHNVWLSVTIGFILATDLISECSQFEPLEKSSVLKSHSRSEIERIFLYIKEELFVYREQFFVDKKDAQISNNYFKLCSRAIQ